VTLIGPVLDDRGYEQLRAELIQRISTFTPEWTDHNDSDPGIALLDLFAFLGEAMLFRFNQIPDATKVAFLNLLHVPALPARPAEVLAALSTPAQDGVQVLKESELLAGAVTFETDDEVYVWPIETLAMIKAAVPPAAEDDPGEQARRCDALFRLGLGLKTPVTFFQPQVLPADPSAPGALPVNVADAVDRALWIAVLHGDGLDRPTLVRDMAGRSLFLGIAADETVDRPFLLDELDAPGAARFRSSGLAPEHPPVLWSLWAADGRPLATLPVARDTTGGLTSTGVVELELPDPLPIPDPTASGGVDSPPPLDDPAHAARVIAWIRASRPASDDPAQAISREPIRRLRWIGPNAVQATQAQSIVAPELLGTGNGGAGQTFHWCSTGSCPAASPSTSRRPVAGGNGPRWRASRRPGPGTGTSAPTLPPVR
jgi:predicted phage baseplate assembly protein